MNEFVRQRKEQSMAIGNNAYKNGNEVTRHMQAHAANDKVQSARRASSQGIEVISLDQTPRILFSMTKKLLS